MDDYTEPCDCGHEFCRGYKYMQIDPFAEEIYGDTSEYLMCDGAAYESAMDI